MADQLLTLYSDLAKPSLTVLKSTLYQGSTILDYFLKSRAVKKDPFRDLRKDPDLKLPTFTGWSRKIFTGSSTGLNSTDVTGGMFKNVNDEIAGKQLEDNGATGEIIPAHVNLAFKINKARLMQIEQLFQNTQTNSDELKNAINSSMKSPKADMRFGFAHAILQGRGGSDPQYSTYTFESPTSVFNVPTTGGLQSWANYGGTPTKRQIEGLFPFVMNGPTGTYAPWGANKKLYMIDQTANPNWAPMVYDFFTDSTSVYTNAPFGYSASAVRTAWVSAAGTIKASSLMSAAANYTKTLGTPACIDILKQAISACRTRGASPELGIMERPLFDLHVRAMESAKWVYGLSGQEKVADLAKMGYPESFVVSDVAFIPDDTTRKFRDGITVNAFPKDTVMLIDFSEFIAEAHKDYNWTETDWEKEPGVVGSFIKEFDATIRVAMPNREFQTIIKYGPIVYTA